MAIGFDVGGTLGIVTPDKNLAKNSKPKVLRSTFGDGYEQRISDGINSLTQTFTVAFSNRPKDEIDDIASFLDAKGGVDNFDYTYPNTNASGNETTVKVVCDDYNLTFGYDDYYSLTATFRRVYEA